MIAPSSSDAIAVRVRIVEEHVSLENEHNLDGIMGTFGEAARYDDEPWGAHYMGRQEVREFYGQLLQAMPDLHIDIQRRHVGEDAIVLEVVIRGRHLGAWRDSPPPVAKSIFRCAAFTHSTSGTSWQVRRSITTVQACSVS